ncbi:MAG: disulfide bond formation protein DsbA [Sulfurimonas sp.]|nr:MAG: disulfide bond formation protein DsbA [Sulfurimonas sp.]
MSLMLKLLTIILLLTSFSYAKTTSEKLENYLTEKYEDNQNIEIITVKVEEVKALEGSKDWKAYIVGLEATLKNKPRELIKQKIIWFSNGSMITKELTNLKNGSNYEDEVKSDIKASEYHKKNLVYGNENAKYKVAIFSDPLCPFCKDFVPEALKYMKKYPNTFAVYYYHFPLLHIHPASAIITRAAVVAERAGVKDVSIKMYDIVVNAKEKDVEKILIAFNKGVGSHVTQIDIQGSSISEVINHDTQFATSLFVSGTPTIYFDSKVDKTRVKYKKVK